MAEPTIVDGAQDGLGAITGLELKSDAPNEQKERARALDSKGTEVKHKYQNVRTEYRTVYNIVDDTNDIASLILGALMNGRIVTSIEIQTGNGEENNTVSFVSHNHAVNAHADTLTQVAIGDFLPQGGVPAFGAVDFGQGTTGDNASAVSGSITFACQHNDKKGGTGDHLIGRNYDAMASGSTTFEGVPTTPVDADVWDTYTSKETPTDNIEFKSTTTSFTAAMVLAAAA